jgi:L-cysteate sulfo-lyase
MATALATLMSRPAVGLAPGPSPLHRLARLERALGPDCPRLFVKRDDLLGFGLGGNKVRKLSLLAAEAARAGADALITCGAVQSNHARVTAAVGAVLGWPVVLVLNGSEPATASGNLSHDLLLGADVRFVSGREQRGEAMAAAADELRAAGRRPFVIPVGGSTPVGAMGMARAVAELSADGHRPDVIFHASSSAGTQAGLTTGCALFGLKTRVVGVSVDEPPEQLAEVVRSLIERMGQTLGGSTESLLGPHGVVVDGRQRGDGYGCPTEASREARALIARTEGVFVDDTYTAKGLAALIAGVRLGDLRRDETVLFWHTGGLIG